MRFAVSIPNFGAFADTALLCDLAREAEARGWDGFFLWDHINWTSEPTLDPWIALTAIAGATRRIRIGPMVTPLARRRPWIIARQTATLDVLSGGRVVLGVGLGFPPDTEFAHLGEDPDARVRAQKLDEALAIIDGLWSGEPFAFEGKQYRIAQARFLPRPVQRPRIPVWVAGMLPARAPLRRAARWDGVFPIHPDDEGFRPLTTDEVRSTRDYIRARRADASPFDIVVGLPLPASDGAAEAAISAYAEAGATWWVCSEFTPGDLRQTLAQLERVRPRA